MILLKIWYHLCAIITNVFYKIIYGKKINIGKNTTWRRNFHIMIDKTAKLSIGKDCFFNNDCSITCLQEITIGDGCLFGENVKMYDHNHKFRDKNVAIKEQGYSVGSIKIGEHCWIGSNVVIMKDTQIGDNCVIGAGCVVSGTIPSNSIVTSDVRNLNIKKMS